MKKILGVLLSLMLVVSGSFLVMAGCGPQEGPGGESPSASDTTSPTPSEPTQEEINSKALTALVMAGTKLAGGKSQADLQLDAYTVTDGVKDYSMRLDARMQLDLAASADKKPAAWVSGSVQQLFGDAASAVGSGLGLDIRYVNDILYLALGDFQVSVPAADFDAVIAAISTFLPGDEGTAAAAAAAAMAAPLAGELPTEGLFGNCTYTETDTDAHATLVLNLSALSEALPPEVVAMLPETVSLDYVVNKTAAGMAFRSLSVKGLEAAGITLDVSLSFAENADFNEIPVPESAVQGGGGYPDGSPLMQAVANTIAKKNFTLNGAFEIINSDGTLAQRTVYEVVVAPKAGGDADVRVKATYYEGANAEKKSVNVSYYTEGWFYVYRYAADGSTPDADAPMRKFAAADVTADIGNALLYVGGDVLNNSMLQLIGAILPGIMEGMGGEAPTEPAAPTDLFGMLSANMKNTDEGCVLTLGLDPTAILPEAVTVSPFTVELATGKSGEQYYLKSLAVGGENGIQVNAMNFLILNVKLTAELDFAASETVNVLEGLNKEDAFVNMGDETSVKEAIDKLPAPEAIAYNKENPQTTLDALAEIDEVYELFFALPKGAQARCDGEKMKALKAKYDEMYDVADLAVSAKSLKAVAELTTVDYGELNSALRSYQNFSAEQKASFDTEYPALKQKLDEAKTKMIELFTAEIAEKITDRLDTLFPNYAPTAEDLTTNEPTNAEIFAAKTALNEIKNYYNGLKNASSSYIIGTKGMVPEADVRKLNALLSRMPAAEVEAGYANLDESSDTYGDTLKKLYSSYKGVAEAYLPYISDATKEGIEVNYAVWLLSEVPAFPNVETTPAEYAKEVAAFNSAASAALAQVKALKEAGYTFPTEFSDGYNAIRVTYGLFTLPVSTDSGYAAAYAAVKADYDTLTDAAKAMLPDWFAGFFAEVAA